MLYNQREVLQMMCRDSPHETRVGYQMMTRHTVAQQHVRCSGDMCPTTAPTCALLWQRIHLLCVRQVIVVLRLMCL